MRSGGARVWLSGKDGTQRLDFVGEIVPDLYAVLVLVFIVAVGLNSLMGRFAERR